MEKDLFIRRMEVILDFIEEQEELSNIINKVTDGHAVVTVGGLLINELIYSINEAMDIDDEDLLFWWLWEDVEKVIYYTNENKEVKVETLEELYDYIISD